MSLSPDAVCKVDEKQSGNRQSHGPEPLSNKELAGRETNAKYLALQSLVSAREVPVRLQNLLNGNCGSSGSRRLRMINGAVIRTSGYNR
jgi:hypothetical protein